MAEEWIRNMQGHPLARIVTEGNGDQKIYNIYGHYLGHYKQSDNTTYNIYGHPIGRGNLIATLIKN